MSNNYPNRQYCAICMGRLYPENGIAPFTCDHDYFHSECINGHFWISNCPICRAERRGTMPSIMDDVSY